MHMIAFHQVTGGAGCSTVAIATALAARDRGEMVGLSGHDQEALSMMMGLGPAGLGEWNDDDADLLVYDAGFAPMGEPIYVEDFEVPNVQHLLVLRCDYISLRKALQLDVRPDGLVVVVEPGRALDAGDVHDVLELPIVATVPWTGAVQRATDAGLLLARMPAALAVVHAIEAV